MGALAAQAAEELAQEQGLGESVLLALFSQFEKYFWQEFDKYASTVIFQKKLIFGIKITIRLEKLREPIAALFNRIEPGEIAG